MQAPRLASFVVLAMLAALNAQTLRLPERWTYNSGCEATGTTLKCSISLPPASTKKVRLAAAVIVCAAATCDYTISRDGTTPTATAGTISRNRSVSPNPDAKWWTGSNSTGGTSLPGAITIPSPGALPLDVADIDLLPGENASISISSGSTQKLQIFLKWEEISR